MRRNEPKGYAWDGADGPAMLRALREASGLSQLELAMRLDDADQHIDQSHLHKIESGRIKRPKAETIEAIISMGLNAPYSIRADVMDAFGYRLPWTLPSEADVAEAQRLCAQELHCARWPSYLSDYSNRIWSWNRFFPRLIGNTFDNPANARYIGVTVLDILFNPALETSGQIANVRSYGPSAVAWYKVTTRSYRKEAWFKEFMTRASTWPGFLTLWEQIPEGPIILLEELPVLPVEIHVPGYQLPFVFRPTLVNHLLDQRFQIVHLVPFDDPTAAICALWAAEPDARLV